MTSFIIKGLAGEKRLAGTIAINGAKNAALKAMAAAVLFDGPVKLENIPDTDDVHTMGEILKKLGAQIEITKNSKGRTTRGLTMKIDASHITSTNIDYELGKTMRASIVLSGPLLSRFSKVSFPMPGGCVIGARGIDLFINGYKSLGAKASVSRCTYDFSASHMSGANIAFNKISVGATETLMLASTLLKGTTVLTNCAMEPEIPSIAEWLNQCGANIIGAGTSTITIHGTGGKLLSAKTPYITIPDRVEAGSFLILGALCASDLRITNCRTENIQSAITVLKQSGVPMTVTDSEVHITGNTKPNAEFKSFNVQTHEYPGFPTDLQAQVVTYLTQVSGESTVIETIFEGRFKYVEDLCLMGANIINMNPLEILVKGPTLLRELSSSQSSEPSADDEELSAHDIRAGFAIVLAALVGKGNFKVNNVHLIDRGYERLEECLQSLGAEVRRRVD